MRIESVRVQNLRAIKDQVIQFNRYTALVGANGSGKSTVLCALNIFFASEDAATDMTDLTEEDFHNRDVKNPIKITVAFGDIGEQAAAALSHYVRKGKLVLTAIAEFDSESGVAKVHQQGERFVHPDLREFFRLHKENKTVPELRPVYQDLRKKFSELPSIATKVGMYDALRSFEEGCQEDELVLEPSTDQFYGAGGSGLLSKYVEWIYVPAVKDASVESTEGTGVALKKLVERTVGERSGISAQVDDLRKEARKDYEEILKNESNVLKELGETIQSKLRRWSSPRAEVELRWQNEPKKSVQIPKPIAGVRAGEGSFLGEIVRQGHGLQRSYLLALLEVLVGDGEEVTPTLLLGCEEPELYQHPPQARHLASVLDNLSEQGAQVIITTHSPYFVSEANFESVRHVRKNYELDLGATVGAVTPDQLKSSLDNLYEVKGQERPNHFVGRRAKLMQHLQPSLNELFFTDRVVFVEGLEDVAYINSWLVIQDLMDGFRQQGWAIVRTDGKSRMIEAAAIADLLDIPSLLVFDGDRRYKDDANHRDEHERDNKALALLKKVKLDDYFPEGGHQEADFWMWQEEIGSDVDAEFKDSLGDEFEKVVNKVRAEFGPMKNMEKNSLFVGAKLLAVSEAGGSSAKLDALCGRLAGVASSP